MKSIDQDWVRAELITRLRSLAPGTSRRWGTMTAGEMLCHLGDASDAVLGIRTPPGLMVSAGPRPILKWLMLRAPMPWPRGVTTRAAVDPRQDGTRPGDFEPDRARVIDGLTALAAAPPERLAPDHFMVGPMTQADWHRWAYKHVDHHLRQFGL